MRITFIALKMTRYSDSQNILTAYSRELGRVAFAVAAGSGKGAVRLRAMTMPLSIVECETEVRPGRELLTLRQGRPLEVMHDVHSNPVKQMLSMFLAEVLSHVIRESGPDSTLYDFISMAVKYLDGVPVGKCGNFHICFLLHLSRILGIEPDVSTYSAGSIFDMRDGIWRKSLPLHADMLMEEEAEVALRLQRMAFGNMAAFRFTRSQRARALDMVLKYYSLHLTPLGGLRSLEILRSMT